MLNGHGTQKEKEEAGVFDDLIRISVGIEDVEDLIEDFKHALREEQEDKKMAVDYSTLEKGRIYAPETKKLFFFDWQS